MAVIIAGCNPALQETLKFDAFQIGGVNRVKKQTYSIGGKGQAAARAIHSWNNANPTKYHVTCHLLQFMGGQNGNILSQQLLLYNKTIRQHTINIDPQQTRTATTICIKNDELQHINGTEIVKPSPIINKTHQIQFLHKFDAFFNDKNVDIQPNIFQISGTIPSIDKNDNDLNESNFYNAMIERIKQLNKDVMIIIDAYKYLPQCLKKNLNNSDGPQQLPMVDTLKINIAELQKLIGVINSEKWKGEMEILLEWIKTFNQLYLVKCLILTDGGNPSYCFDFSSKCYWKYELPQIYKVLNPIGCGDTCTGILSSVLSQTLLNVDDFNKNKHNALKWNWTDSIIAHATKWGLAAAVAATQTMKLGEFDPNICCQMFDKIKTSKHML